MQDNDFDKLFSHKFGQLPGEPYGEEHWTALSRRMDHERRRRWLLPVLLTLLGLLAGGNVFWWYQWREASHNIQTADSHTNSLKTDTVIHRTVVYHYDTIYQNITFVRRQFAEGPTAMGHAVPGGVISSAGTSAAGPGAAVVPGEQQSRPEGVSPAQPYTPAGAKTQDIVHQQAAHADEAMPEYPFGNNIPADTAQQTILSRPTETPATDSLFEDLSQNQPSPTKKVQAPFLYFARPRLGGSAVLGIPYQLHDAEGFIWGANVCADVELARNLRIGAEIGYQQAKLKSEETEALKDMEIEIPEPGGDFELKYWEANAVPAFIYGLHLRYEIPLRGNWTPWIGLGGQAASYLPFEMEFEFENETNNLELHVPAKSEPTTRFQGFLFRLGVEYHLNKHLNWGAEGYLLRNFGEEPGLLDNQIGLKTSLYYKF